MIDMARARDLVLMEALWTRFLPAIVKVRELVAAGAIGEVRMLQADFGFPGPTSIPAAGSSPPNWPAGPSSMWASTP